jgi:hypothetical protein
MDDQRVPNLEEMDEQEASQFLAELFSHLSAQEEYELRHQDYVMEMPQSGESIRGREKMREFQEAYPTPPTIQLRRVLVRDGLWVVEGVDDYGGGQVFDVVLTLELRDGKMWRDRRYYVRSHSRRRSGSSGWNPRARAQPNFPENIYSTVHSPDIAACQGADDQPFPGTDTVVLSRVPRYPMGSTSPVMLATLCRRLSGSKTFFQSGWKMSFLASSMAILAPAEKSHSISSNATASAMLI